MARTTVVGSAEYQVGGDLTPLRKDLRTAEGMFKRHEAELKKGVVAGVGLGAGAIGVTAVAAGARALIDGLSGAIESAAEFEAQLATINTVADLSERQLKALGEGVKDLSEDTGIATGELNAAYYDLVSAGVDAAKAHDVLTDATTLATGALSTTGEAVDLMTSSINAWKLEASDSSRVMDVWARTVANGKITASQLASSIAQIAPIASAAGVSIEEVAAGYATMTAQGTPAAQASTQMRAAITALLKPNAQLVELQKQLVDTTFEHMLREEGLAATLQAVSDAAAGKTDAITKALGSTEAYNGMLQITGANAATFSSNLQDMRQSATQGGNALKMAGERMNTLQNRQARLAAMQARFGQDIGEALLPFMEGVVGLGMGVIQTLRGMADGINAIIEGAQRFLEPWRDVNEEMLLFAETLPDDIGDRFLEWADAQREAAAAGHAHLESLEELGRQGEQYRDGIVATVAEMRALGRTSDEVNEEIARATGTTTEQVREQGRIAREAGLSLREQVEALILLSRGESEAASAIRETTEVQSFAQKQWQEFLDANPDVVKALEELAAAAAPAPPTIEAAVAALDGLTAPRDTSNIRRFAQEFEAIPDSMADAIRSGKGTVRDAMKDLTWALKNPMKTLKTVAFIEGKLTGDKLKEALRSKNPAIRAEGERTRAVLIAEWEKLSGESWDYGKSVSENLAGGVKARRAAAREEARALRNGVTEMLDGAGDDARSSGASIATQFAAGIRSNIQKVIAAAVAMAQAVEDNTKTGSPTKSGPLSKDGGIEAWGARAGELFSRGLSSHIDLGAAMGARLPTLAPAVASRRSGDINLTINIPTQTFLGFPEDAQRLGRQLAPTILREFDRLALRP